MARIFSSLAVISLLMLVANFCVGLNIGDFNGIASEYLSLQKETRQAEKDPATSTEKLAEVKSRAAAAKEKIAPPRRQMTIHFFLGVASSLLAVLVNSITVTYFIGTNRWCREVVETYHLPGKLAEESARLKRRTFPYALLGMLTILAIVTLGALSDPSVPWNLGRSARYVQFHYIAAMAGTALLAYLFWLQAERIAANYAIIQRILQQVEIIRGRGGEGETVATHSAAPPSAKGSA